METGGSACRHGVGQSADILVSGNWNHQKNETGWAGRSTQGGVAGHGTSSPYDIHNTLIAAGPDFRERTRSRVPTSNADLAPTLLKLMGLTIPNTMSGRSIDEALRGGPALGSVQAVRRVETARLADGAYQVDAQVTRVGCARYLDFTEVRRSTPTTVPR